MSVKRPFFRLVASLLMLALAQAAPALQAMESGASTGLLPVAAPSNGVGFTGSLDRGALGLGQAIRRLGVIASVLHTGAHPDDEDSGLLAYLARGRQARTAYLSLTRGDGGQNLIGPEIYELLGVIRTDELLAARRLDGAEQFFSRAFDFGFSKSREEALSKWDREAVLADMVRVIRTFRPLVIVSQWSGTTADGHGHHQAAGSLTPEAFKAAGEPSRFPEQIRAGLKPWKAFKLYVRSPERRQQNRPADTAEKALLINTGEFDTLLGRSYYEIAMQGRSQHRSQDMGTLERRGPQFSRLRLLESSTATEQDEADIFAGIDTSLKGIATLAGGGGAELLAHLSELQSIADEAAQRYSAFAPATLTPVLARGLKKIREIRRLALPARAGETAAYDAAFLLARKERDFADALARAEGVVVDCISDDEVVIPGQPFKVTVTAYTNSGAAVRGVNLVTPQGWSVVQKKQGSSATAGRLVSSTEFEVVVAPDADYTQPYWLRNKRRGDMFIPGEGGTGIEPNAPPPVVANLELQAGGEPLLLTQPAQYQFADKAFGEIRRDLKVAPVVSITISPRVVIFPKSGQANERDVTVSLVNNSRQGARGIVKLKVDPSWRVKGPDGAFDLKREGERASLTFSVTAPQNGGEGVRPIAAEVSVDGQDLRSGYQVIAYPHTEARYVYSESVASAGVLDVKVAPNLKVGFIQGAGDDFPTALSQLGVDVAIIDGRELATGDLSRFDAIVTGIRVYEVRPDVVANNERLLDYVKQGGTVIVQYNKAEFARGGFAPYPIKMEQTIERVTDETAPVAILDTSHPLFNYPNKITERDFEGWVQERGAYFLKEWDASFKPLLSSFDKGEEPKLGGQLIAKYGKGYYVYTAYAWFRQIPEGVPGAYRLIANLVSLPKAATAGARQGRANR